MRVELLQSPHSGRERITPIYVLKEWFGVKDGATDPNTVQRWVPGLQEFFNNYYIQNRKDQAVVTDWQMVPEYTEISLPSVYRRFVDETVEHWGEKDGNKLVSNEHEIAIVTRNNTGETMISIPNSEIIFPGTLKISLVFQAINATIRRHANQQIESSEIREVLANVDIPKFSNGLLIIGPSNSQKAA